MPQPATPVQQLNTAPRLIFVRQQFSAFGGAELILDRTLQALAARGERIGLLARTWRERDGIEFIRCNPPKLARPFRETMFARAACRALAAYPHSLVQAHERIPCCDIFRAGDGVHAAYLEQRRRGTSAIGKLALSFSAFHRNTLKLERAMFASPRLKAVIVNSMMVADDLVRHYGYPQERIHLVPNGIDLKRFSPDQRELHRTETRKKLGIPATAPVALFVGSGFERKGLAQAIQAAARSKDVHLVVVGSDRRPTAFQRLAAQVGMTDRFHLVGPVADPVPYYAATDTLILPTVYDPFPSTVLEALACGLPVVTTTGCGARDIVRELNPSLVCDAIDTDGLASGLRRSLSLAANTSTADSARRLAAGFDIETMVKRMLSVYDNLMPNGSPA